MSAVPNGIAATVLLAAIGLYRRFVSPVLPLACRFHPTCSRYAAEAIRVHGPWRGLLLSVKRISRCHPLNDGGIDPVPSKERHA